MNSTTEFPSTKTTEHVPEVEVQLQIKDAALLWVTCELVLVICTVLSIYQMVCLISYGCRQYRKYHHYPAKTCRARTLGTSFVSNNSDQGKRTLRVDNPPVGDRSPKEKAYQLWMIGLGIAATGISSTKFFADQLKFTYAWKARSNVVCEVLNDVTEIGLYGCVAICVYGFLWLKQWIFYHNPAVSELLYREGLICFSRSLPIIILAISFVVAITNFIPLRYCYDVTVGDGYVGCISVYDVRKTADAWPIFFYISVTSTFQVSLLMLFLYPLLRRQIDMCKNRRKKTIVRAYNSQHTHNVQKPVYREILYSSATSVTPTSKILPNSIFTESCINKECEMSDIKVSEQIDSNKNQITKFKSNKVNSISVTPPSSPMYQRNSPKTPPRLMRNLNHHKASISSMINVRCEKLRKKYEKSKAINSVGRASIWTALCIVTDVTVVAISLWLGPGAPLILITTMNNLNIVVNEFCVIATFSNWKEILFSVFRRKMSNPSKNTPCKEFSANSRRDTVVSNV